MPPKKTAPRVPPGRAATKPPAAAAVVPPPVAPSTDFSLAEFDQLVEDILENPDKVLDPNLTQEQILEIQKRLNPYVGIAGPAASEEHKRIVACSYTNLREDYIRRLTMTSLVGFVFQMLHEWDVPAEQRTWIPEVAAKKVDDPAFQPFDVDKLVERLDATLAVAKEAQTAKAEIVQRRQEALDALAASRLASADEREAAKSRVAEADQVVLVAEAKAAGLLYAATHATHRAGLEAGARLHATAEAGFKFPLVREVLSRFPLPPPPGLVEMPAKLAKGVIGGFLRHWFEFDPSVHTRSGYDAKKMTAAIEEVLVGADKAPVQVDSKDPHHLTVAAVREAAPKPHAEHADAVELILGSKKSYDAVAMLLRDDDLATAALTAIASPETFRHYLFPVPKTSAARPAADTVPPQDTFHRWGYYTEVNYEELRTVTEALYPERADLDWAIALWEVFEGTQKEVDDAFAAHCQRYQDEVPSSIKALEMGSWSLLADFKANRKNIQFYNKHTEVLKRILDRHADDKRIGAELMRNRVKQGKAKNIAQDGPDAPGLKEYRRAVAQGGQDIGAKGAERVISQEEMRRLEKAKGNIKAAQELELLEQYERTIAECDSISKNRALTDEEKRDYETAKLHIARTHEMVAVPDDSIQVDVFTTNAATGQMEKTHFYTKAEAPPVRESGNDAPGASSHPAVRRSVATAGSSASATSAAPAVAPELASYAVEHIVADTQQKRTNAQMHEEAKRDHDRNAPPSE